MHKIMNFLKNKIFVQSTAKSLSLSLTCRCLTSDIIVIYMYTYLTHLYGHGIYLPFTDTFWTYAVIYSLTTLLYMPYRPYLEGSNSNSCPFLCRFSLKQIWPKNKKSFTTSGEYILSLFCCQAKNGEIKIPEKPYTY